MELEEGKGSAERVAGKIFEWGMLVEKKKVKTAVKDLKILMSGKSARVAKI